MHTPDAHLGLCEIARGIALAHAAAGHSRRPADRAFATLCPELRANSHQGARYNGSCAALSSQTPLPPPPTPCQTMCSAYGKRYQTHHTVSVFRADSPRRQDDADTSQIVLGGGRSAVWHVLITRSRRRDTQVFLPPLLACAGDTCAQVEMLAARFCNPRGRCACGCWCVAGAPA
jgi:hypothetical protein